MIFCAARLPVRVSLVRCVYRLVLARGLLLPYMYSGPYASIHRQQSSTIVHARYACIVNSRQPSFMHVINCSSSIIIHTHIEPLSLHTHIAPSHYTHKSPPLITHTSVNNNRQQAETTLTRSGQPTEAGILKRRVSRHRGQACAAPESQWRTCCRTGGIQSYSVHHRWQARTRRRAPSGATRRGALRRASLPYKDPAQPWASTCAH